MSYGQVAPAQPIKKASEHPSDEPQDRSFGSANHILPTDHPSDEFSAQPITSIGQIIFGWTFFGRIILQTNLWLSQSYPLVGLSSDGLSSDGSSFGHIHRLDYLWTDFLRTDHPSDESLAQPITSIGRIIFGQTFFGRIIFRKNLRFSQSHPSAGLSLDGLSL